MGEYDPFLQGADIEVRLEGRDVFRWLPIDAGDSHVAAALLKAGADSGGGAAGVEHIIHHQNLVVGGDGVEHGVGILELHFVVALPDAGIAVTFHG